MLEDEARGLDFWTRWQVLVCALIVAAPPMAASVVLSKSANERLRPSDLWIPCWRDLHPIWLLVFRALVAVIMSSLLSQIVARDGPFAFYFYTQWTFTLVLVYFVIGTVISAHGCWMNFKRGVEELGASNEVRLLDYKFKEESEKGAGFWGYAMQIIYQTGAGAAIFTDVIFWGILAPDTGSQGFTSNPLGTCMHSLNVIFLLLDTVLNSQPFPSFRMAYFIFWSCVYVIFQWVYHACVFTRWPYPFLDLANPWAPAWYLGMALIHLPCYFSYWLLVRAKNLFLPRWFPRAYVRSH